MAENPRIHPVHHDVEAALTPTAPLVPRGSSKSEKSDSMDHYRQPEQPPTPPQRSFPVSHSRPPKRKRSCFCRCFCWTISLLILIIIIIAAVVGILYLVFQPKVPKYSVNGITVMDFSLSNNMSLSATFNVNVTTTNPNKKIGIYYEGGSHLSAWYMDTKLCEGSWPKFYQGHKNTTVLDVSLTGETQNATSILTEVQQQESSTGNIPLKLKAKVPVRIKLGSLKLMKINFRVRCTLVVGSLTSGTALSISSNSCKFSLDL